MKTVLSLLLSAALLPAADSRTYESLNALVWTQRAAEHTAISLQTFQVARVALTKALKDRKWTACDEQTKGFRALPPAIILDLDETVLDNSAFMARLVRDGTHYTEELWREWVGKRQARALPGSVDFLNAVRKQGVAVFYITNRVCDPSDKADHTVAQLRLLGFPVENDRVMCRAGDSQPSDKSPRRARAAQTHRILAMFGDDLNDFVTVPNEERDHAVQAHHDYWGTRWFVLPNPMYGSWERAVGGTVQSKIEALRP